MVDRLILVHRWWRDEHVEVVPLLRRHLVHSRAVDVSQADVVHNNVGVVLGAPFLDIGVIEPLVIPWHEVAPLQDLQRLLLGAGAAMDDNTGVDTRSQGHRACRMEQLPSRYPVSRAVHLRASISIRYNTCARMVK